MNFYIIINGIEITNTELIDGQMKVFAMKYAEDTGKPMHAEFMLPEFKLIENKGFPEKTLEYLMNVLEKCRDDILLNTGRGLITD